MSGLLSIYIYRVSIPQHAYQQPGSPEGVTCVPIQDVHIILNAHYNLMYQLVYEGR